MHAFADHEVHFFRGGAHVVNLVEGHTVARRANDTYGIVRHENVTIGWLAAAVQHHVVDAVPEDEQGALGGEHVDLDARQLCHGLPPDAGCVDDEAAMDFRRLAGAVVA